MMCVVYVVVLTVGLAVQILAATNCSQNGAVRFDPELDTNEGPEAGYVQLCVGGQWSGLCGNFFRVEVSVICRQLGYNEYGTTKGRYSDPTNCGYTLDRCRGGESTVAECNLLTQTYHHNYNWIKCQPANCTDGSLRLVGGASHREGRVEVCVDGRWGTVCYNEQLAGTVCSQLGFSNQGPKANHTNIPGPKANCTTGTNELSCSNITTQQGSLCEGLTVQCAKSSENECPTTRPNINCTTGTIELSCSNITTQQGSLCEGLTVQCAKSSENNSTGNACPTSDNTNQANIIIALSAAIGLLAILETGTLIACILCFARKKWNTKTPPPKQIRGLTSITYRRTVKTDNTLGSESGTAASSTEAVDNETMVTSNIDDKRCETMATKGIDGNETTVTSNEDTEGYEAMVHIGEEIENFYVVNPNEASEITPCGPDHPPPVGGVSEESDDDDDYINAEVYKK